MTDINIKNNLAAAYRWLALNNMDDLTYTHLSARPDNTDYFYIYPFGLLFEEVTASCLLKVSLNGEILEGNEFQYNKTGYIIHGSIYKNRPDLNAIFHLHTIAGVAVSANPDGLLPISQFALHFYNQIAYHDYNSLALDNNIHGNDLIADLADKKVAILRNHGTLCCGKNIQEANFYTHHLEQACKVQIAATNNQNLININHDIAQQSVNDLLSFEKNLGERDWQAILRKLDRLKINYKI